jgi:type IV conjugative transfer system protein TraL
MKSENQYRHPRRFNEPMLIFAWPMPQVLPAIGLMGLSMLVGHFLIFLVLSVFWWLLYAYTTRRYAPGVILHYLYWHGWTTGLTKECAGVPDSMKREFYQ